MGRKLEANLAALSEWLRRGNYGASPVKRHYIPKVDELQRPISVPSLLEERNELIAIFVSSNQNRTMQFSRGTQQVAASKFDMRSKYLFHFNGTDHPCLLIVNQLNETPFSTLVGHEEEKLTLAHE